MAPLSKGGRVAGNRLPGTPPRKKVYINSSIPRAAEAILSAAGGHGLHADEVARAIYEIDNAAQLRQVKRGLVSELHRLVKRRLAVKRVANMFAWKSPT